MVHQRTGFQKRQFQLYLTQQKQHKEKHPQPNSQEQLKQKIDVSALDKQDRDAATQEETHIRKELSDMTTPPLAEF